MTAGEYGTRENVDALGRIFARIDKKVTVTPPWAYGAEITMGEIAGVICASCHTDRDYSAIGCAGEAAEIVAQSGLVPEHLKPSATCNNCPEALEKFRLEAAPDIVACNVFDGQLAAIPASLCFFDYRISPDMPVSSGCAAGPSVSAAMRTALLELIEHTVRADWWNNEATSMFSDPTEWQDLSTLVTPMLVCLRGPATEKRDTFAMRIGGMAGVEVVAAWAFDAGTDEGFVVATSADGDLQKAAFDALRELCQLELNLYNARYLLKANGLHPSQSDSAALKFSNRITRSDPRLAVSCDIFLAGNGRADDPDVDRLVSDLRKICSACYRVVLHEEPGLAVVKAIVPEWIRTEAPF